MVIYMVMRVLYGIYLFMLCFMFLRIVSRVLFNKVGGVKYLVKELGFAVIWPLSLFTPKGRVRLCKSIPFINN